MRRVARQGDPNRDGEAAFQENPLLKGFNGGTSINKILHHVPVVLLKPPQHAKILQFQPSQTHPPKDPHKPKQPPLWLLATQTHRLHLPPPEEGHPAAGLPRPHGGAHVGSGRSGGGLGVAWILVIYSHGKGMW